MGTRVDFYVGCGESAEWLGSYPFDGYPSGVFAAVDDELLSRLASEEDWRTWVAAFLTGPNATLPEQGWPWPWNDSATTDYAYAWDDGAIYGSCFGHDWFRVDPGDESWGEPELEGSAKTAVFPDMSARKAVTFGPRSSLIIVGE